MAKDPFEDLPMEFKEAMEKSSVEELKQTLANIATNEETNVSAQKADEDLQQLREKVTVASKAYREATKMNKLKTKFCRRILADKGDAASQKIVMLDVQAGG